MEQQLLNYVEQEFKRDVPEQLVKKALHDAGWGDGQIEEAFKAVRAKAAPAQPVLGISPDEEVQILDEAEKMEKGAKKNKKPMIAAISVFASMVIVIGGLIVYYSFSSQPADELSVKNADIATPAESDSGQTVSPPAANITEPEPVSEEDTVIPPVQTIPPNEATSTAATTTTPVVNETSIRDAQRMADMRALVETQKSVFEANQKYYTCGLGGGDCKGKPYGYPARIGTALAVTPQDPLASQYAVNKAVCGRDYVYCGLNNAPYPQFFCYYAKLGGGGYYTASHGGNVKRSTPPKIFEECAIAN